MEDIIANLGFPIASVVGLAYYFVQKDKSSREVNAKLLASNEILAKEISTKLDELLEKVGV